jgi:hypothetical protein
MKSLQLLFFVLVAGVSFGFSQTCQTVSAVPAGQLKMGGGKLILEADAVVSIKGGQAVYAKISNDNATGASYWVVMEILDESTKRYMTNCTYKAIVAPNTSAVVRGSTSAEPPIPWRVSVTLGQGSDSDGDEAFPLDYEVFSNPKKNSPKQ